jgi:hypothetical protein
MDSWDEFESDCKRAIDRLRTEGSGETGNQPVAVAETVTIAPTRPVRAPTTTLPTETPVSGCSPNPAVLHIVNELGADLALELGLDRTYRLAISAGQARDVCLPPSEYAYTATAQGFNALAGTRQLAAGVHRCWWFKGEGGERRCNAPPDDSAYWPP